jgi:hypothetical protein
MPRPNRLPKRLGVFRTRHGLEMPSSDWYTETTTRHGEQECYNVMAAGKGEDWEPREVFIKYMSRHAQRNGEVELHPVHINDSFIKVYKTDNDDDNE